MRRSVPCSLIVRTNAALCSAGATSRQRATAAFMSSFIASEHSQAMSVVWLNLHATDSKIMPSVLATKGQTWPNICLGVGQAFGSVLGSISSMSGLMRPSSAMYHAPAKRPPKTIGATTSPRGRASLNPSVRGPGVVERRRGVWGSNRVTRWLTSRPQASRPILACIGERAVLRVTPRVDGGEYARTRGAKTAGRESQLKHNTNTFIRKASSGQIAQIKARAADPRALALRTAAAACPVRRACRAAARLRAGRLARRRLDELELYGLCGGDGGRPPPLLPGRRRRLLRRLAPGHHDCEGQGGTGAHRYRCREHGRACAGTDGRAGTDGCARREAPREH
eukprot:scaffold23612_cov66-Phaeocystis_antarctica.AAC.5